VPVLKQLVCLQLAIGTTSTETIGADYAFVGLLEKKPLSVCKTSIGHPPKKQCMVG
jgi:hypothetical protein